MDAITESLPGLGAALVPGPVFFRMTLLGRPVAKARARTRVIKKDGRWIAIHYPEPETAKYEDAIKKIAAIKMGPWPPKETALCCLIIADIPVPASWSLKDRTAALEGRKLPTSRPDWDNYAKAACDALNKVVYQDDAQLVDCRTIKRYSASPALTIEIREFVSP